MNDLVEFAVIQFTSIKHEVAHWPQQVERSLYQFKHDAGRIVLVSDHEPLIDELLQDGVRVYRHFVILGNVGEQLFKPFYFGLAQ